VYTKNLKKTVKVEDLKSAYEKAFGKIENAKVTLGKSTKPVVEGETPAVETCAGFMNFEKKEDAKKAIAEASKVKEILDLY